MKQILAVLCVAVMPLLSTAQKSKVDSLMFSAEKGHYNVNAILYQPVSGLKDSPVLKELEAKHAIKLNTIESCLMLYKNAEKIPLTETEEKEVVNRVIAIADKFINEKNYVLFETSYGMVSPMEAREEIVSGKSVTKVSIGLGCVIDFESKRESILLYVFTNRVEKALGI